MIYARLACIIYGMRYCCAMLACIYIYTSLLVNVAGIKDDVYRLSVAPEFHNVILFLRH